MADSYTITFKDGGTDSDKTSSLTSTTVSDYVDAGAEYVSAIAPTGKVYFAKTGAGLKFGNSSGGGSVTLTLATPIKPTSIVISASQFGASEGSGLFQEETFDMTGGGGKYAFNDYTVTYDGETEVATISVGTAKRGYVNSITVNYASQGGEEPVVKPETKTIYLNGGGSSLWNQADPEFFVHSWGGAADGDVHMTLVEGDVYKADIPADNTDLLFLRLATGTTEIVWSGDAHWNQSTDQTIPEGKDLFTMTSWDNGEWSVYSAQGGDDPEPVDPTPAEKDSIYFVNVAGWAAPRVHLWGGTAAGTEWPGVEMTKLDDQINNYDVYKYVADKGAYANCLFSDNGAEDKKTADLTWTSGKYFYNDAWYALNEIPAPLPDAVPLEGNIWKVTAETPLVAGSHYINEALLTMDGVYATSLKTNTRTIAGEEFTHAIQVRTDGYPTADKKAGKEKSGSTSLIITAKEDADVTFYYNRQVVGEGGTDNDNKDLIVFDQADITTKVAGVFTIDQILEGNNYLNATKKVALKKDHTYTVTASGTTLQLHGIKLEAHFPVMQIAGAWNVQDEAWLLNDMNLAEDKLTATYEVELTPGDYEFKMIKDGAWLTKANEGQAYGLHREWSGVAGVIDDASENLKVTADVAGNYVFTWTFANDSIGIAFPAAPVVEDPAKFYITGDSALVVDAGLDAEMQWNPAAIKSEKDTLVLNLKADQYYILKVAVNGTWEGENNVKGYNELTEKTEGLEDEGNDHNIRFKLNEAGYVKVIYKAAEGENPEIFKLEGDFYVAPVEPTAKFYVTGNEALVGAELAWNPSAIKSMNDTLVLNLEADIDYILKVTVNGTWEGENNVKGYNELTEKTEGLLDVSDDHNIGFKLAEAGEVKVVYIAAEGENPEIFKLIGDFYVAPVEPEEHTYTVAGDNVTLFGMSWAPALEVNDMTLVEGIYKWEKSEVALAEGSVQFKVVKDHDWNYGSYPADNYQLAIPADGIYTVTITLDPANLTVNASAEKTGDAEVEKHYLVAGQAMVANGEDWNNDADINLMTSSDEGLTYTLEIADLQLIAGTLYRYKIVEKGSWVEYFPKHVDNSDTCFTVPQDGIYTITYVYTVATSLCEVQAQRTGDLPAARLTDGYYLVGNFSGVPAWSVDGLTDAQRFVEVESDEYGTYYSLTADLAVDDSIKVVKIVHDAIVLWMPEGTGNNVFIDANHAGEAKIIHLDVAVNGAWRYYVEPNIQDGFYLLGSLNNWTPSDEYRFGKDATCGENEFVLNTTLTIDDQIKVAKVENGVATTWYPEGEGNNYVVDAAHEGVKAIYFQETYKEDWVAFGGYFWMGENGGTAISNTAADAEAVKVLHNGMLLIRKGNKTYNIMGQAVK